MAEVHSARRESKTGSSGEGEAEDSSGIASPGEGEKRKKKVRRKGTFLVRHKSPVESTTDEINHPKPSDKEVISTMFLRGQLCRKIMLFFSYFQHSLIEL